MNSCEKEARDRYEDQIAMRQELISVELWVAPRSENITDAIDQSYNALRRAIRDCED